MPNVSIPDAARQYGQIVILAGCFAALTEQDRMEGSSIKALISDRDTTSDQFDLCMRDRAKFSGKIPHPLAR